MRVVYITVNDLDRESDGVVKKSLDQINALKSLADRVSIIYLRSNELVFIDDSIGTTVVRLPHKYLFMLRLEKLLKGLDKVDLVYIRNPHGGLHTAFVSRVSKAAKMISSKVVLEIPHFPYDSESSGLLESVSVKLHSINRKSLRSYVDLVAYTGQATESIWGMKSLRIRNSVDIDRIRQKRRPCHRDGLVFIGVANPARWHGYDRLIRGIREYKQKPGGMHVKFIVVGPENAELRRLRSLTKDLGIEDSACFTGPLSGQQLDDAFESADIGVDALGRHRSGNNVNDSIKSKEYCARDVPFIKSHEDDSLCGAKFVLTVDANESPIAISEVIEWFSSLDAPPGSIREFAAQHFTWRKQMQDVIGALNFG